MSRIVLVMLCCLTLVLAGCSQDNGAQVEQGLATTLRSEATIGVQDEGGRAFIAIHCEPGPDPSSTAYVALNWPSLIDLVESADRHGMELTLLMNPQWATYILEDPSRLALVRNWEVDGHELGLHTHGPHMNTWNGYTDQEGYFGAPDFLGTMDDLMQLVNRLPASGEMVTACIAPEEDQEQDCPAGILYEINGGLNKLDDLWSTPTGCTLNEHSVLRLTHARYAATFNQTNIDLRQMTKLLDKGGETEVMGLVFHCREYAEDPAPFDELFSLLEARGVHTRTVAEIMESY